MQHPDEGTIHAWIDGQLTADEAAALEAHAGECAECRAAIADARGIIAASSRIVSALDIVPGGVIPEVPIDAGVESLEQRRRRKPWYASTQLRAAAAVLFVAAASLMVVRQRGAEDLPRAASELRAVPGAGAAAAAAPETEQSTADEVAASSGARDAAGSATTTRGSAPAAKASAPREADRDLSARGTVADAAPAAKGSDAPAILAAPAPAPAQVQVQAQAQANRVGFTAPPRLEGVVVTGVATTAGEREAAKASGIVLLRTDTAVGAITTVYRVPEGVEVALTETESMSTLFAGKGVMDRERRLQAQGTARVSTAGAPPPPAARRDSTNQAPVISIRWTDSAANRLYILSGAVSKERLEAIRKEIERR